MLEESSRVFRFGPFRLDPQERILLLHDEVVSITPKAFDTLSVLLDHAGHVVTKDDLLKAVWPKVVVEEATLAQNVATIRRVLSKGGSAGDFIETVPKHGYRFVGPVRSETVPRAAAGRREVVRHPPRKEPERRFEAVSDVRGELWEGKEELNSRPEIEQPRARARRLPWMAPAALIMALLAVSAWWLLRPTGESKPVLNAVPFTTYPGAEFDPTFSPDGSKVAFAGFLDEKEPNLDIYVKSVGSENPLRLTFAPELEANPHWSPDGSYIAFFRFKNDRFTIYTIPPLGGAERKVYETEYLWKPGILARLLTCTPDSKGIVFTEARSPHEPSALFMVRFETGEKVRLTSPPAGSVGDNDPVFSPDGRILSFSRVHALWSFSDLYRLDLSSDFTPVAEPVPVTEQMPVRFRDFTGHAWSANGREIIASLQRGFHGRDLWRIPLDDPQHSTRLEFAGERAVFPVISGSARRMVYVQEQPGIASIWHLEDSGQLEKQAIPTRLFGSTQCEGLCQVSPDGAKVAFESVRTGFSEICVSNSDGSGFLRLTDYEGPRCAFPAWSPDSRWITYEARPEGQSEIYVISAEGGHPQQMTHDPGDDIRPSWSRDGRWIYFTSNRTGRWQVWKMPSDRGEPVQVTQEGGWYGKESPDGRTLFFGKAVPELGVYRMPVGGGEQDLFLPDAFIEFFAPTANGFYFWPIKGSYFWAPEGTLVFLDSLTGTRRVVTVTDQVPTSVSAFPDGKRVMFSQMGHTFSDLYLVENFR
jgi:Tol biopolymer transport system component/DNA-binding winged helix-turn-helix (wHTH) protein